MASSYDPVLRSPKKRKVGQAWSFNSDNDRGLVGSRVDDVNGSVVTYNASKAKNRVQLDDSNYNKSMI